MLPCVSLCVGGKWEWTLYLFDRNLEMSVWEDLPFLGLWLQGSHLDEVNTGLWFSFACYMSENFLGANFAELASFHS